MDRTKKVLITLLVIGALATIGAGTYATFTAQTSNTGNTFTTGTLILSDTNPTGTVCTSTDTATTITNNQGSGGCGVVINGGITKPGDNTTGIVTIKNTGSVAASTLTLWVPACTDGTSGSPAGTGKPCSDSGSPFLAFIATCGSVTGTTCNSPTYIYNNGTYATTTDNLYDLITNHNTLATGISVGSLAAGATAYVQIGLDFNNGAAGAENAYMATTGTFTVNFTAAQ